MPVLRILETSLYANDLAAAERFYIDVIGLERHSREENRHVFFRCGNGMLLVFNPEQTSQSPGNVAGAPVPAHGAQGPGHLAFAVAEADMPAWRSRLKHSRIEIESEIRWPGGGRSLYFRDPAGNSVELATPEIWGLSLS